MNTTSRNRITLLACFAAMSALAGGADAQTLNSAFWEPAGSGDWNTNSNWSVGGVPSSGFNEVAVINNDGTAQLTSAAAFTVGGVTVGGNGPDATLPGDGLGGALEIGSGGSLNVISTGVTDGVLRVGGDGQVGTLLVEPGGSLDTLKLSSFEFPSLVSFGSTSVAGATTVNANGAALRSRAQILGSEVQFSTNSLWFNGNTTLQYVATAGGVSTIDVNGSTLLGGALELGFEGVTPTIGDSWNLIDSQAIASDFASVGPSTAGSLPSGSVLATQVAAGGTNGAVLSVSVEETATVRINRDTGQAQLVNDSGQGVGISGYQLSAPGGVLNTGWNSLADQGVAGFEEASPTATQLGELDPTGSSSLDASGRSLGLVYTPATPAFGTPFNENVSLSIQRDDGQTLPGLVEFVGDGFANNLVLTIDPATGDARITNDSPGEIGIDVYTVASELGALQTGWDSLADQGIGDWVEGNPSAGRVSELEPTGQLNLASKAFIELDGLWNSGVGSADPADLELAFRVPGVGELTGVVEFATLDATLTGDYNADGRVDAADYTVYRDNLGRDVVLPNSPATSGVVGQAELDAWASNFGAVAAPSSVAVPEPSALGLLLGAGALALTRRRRVAAPSAAPKTQRQSGVTAMNLSKLVAVVSCLVLATRSDAQTTITGAEIDAAGLTQPFTDGSITISPFAAGGAPGSFGSNTVGGFIGVSGGSNENAVDDLDGDPATTNDQERFDLTLGSGVGLSQIGYSFSRANPIRISGFTEDPQAFFSATTDSPDLLTYDDVNDELLIYQRQFSGNVVTVDFLNTAASENQVLSVTATDLISTLPQVSFRSFSYDVAGPAPLLGDVDGDDLVTLTDFGIIRDNFGLAGVPSTGDLTRDGVVGLADFDVWEANFAGSSTGLRGLLTIPEPTTLALLVAGCLLGRRRN